jgi:hypothetical protein
MLAAFGLLAAACDGKSTTSKISTDKSETKPTHEPDAWELDSQHDVISQRDVLHLRKTIETNSQNHMKVAIDLTCPTLGTISASVIAVDTELLWSQSTNDFVAQGFLGAAGIASNPLSTQIQWRIGKSAHNGEAGRQKYSNEIIVTKFFKPSATEIWNGSLAVAFETVHGPIGVEQSIDTPNAHEFALRCQAIDPTPSASETTDLNHVVLGVAFDLNAHCMRPDRLGKPQGALVIGAVAGGAADRAGIRAGDIILKIGVTNIGEPRQVREASGKAKPGDSIDVLVIRDKKEMIVGVEFMAVDAAALPDNQFRQTTQFSDNVIEPALRKELLAMAESDQRVRQPGRFDASAAKGIDAKNLIRLKEIIKQFGWPTIAMVGGDGANAASLLVSHADMDPDFQRSVFSMMEPLVKSCEVRPLQVAYIYDRTHVPQRYGTAGTCQRAGVWVADPIEDAQHVDLRRTEVGIPSMADSAVALNKMCTVEAP